MKIRVTGVDRIIRKLRRYQQGLEEKQRKFLEELAKIGIDTAAVKFSEAIYDGENDVAVGRTPEWIGENRLLITASGRPITFIEFGSGVHYTEQHPKAAEMGFTRGTYGKGKGSLDSWTYYGSPGTAGKFVRESDKGTVYRTHGNPPARAMYDAGKEMRNRIVEIAREVYGK